MVLRQTATDSGDAGREVCAVMVVGELEGDFIAARRSARAVAVTVSRPLVLPLNSVILL